MQIALSARSLRGCCARIIRAYSQPASVTPCTAETVSASDLPLAEDRCKGEQACQSLASLQRLSFCQVGRKERQGDDFRSTESSTESASGWRSQDG
jgi:hypothetical protein